MAYQDIILEEFAEIHHRIYYIRNNRWFCHRFRIWRHICYLPSHGNQGYGSKFHFNSDLCSNGHCRNNLIGYRCALGFTICHIIPHVMLKQKEEKLKPWSTYKEGVKHLGSIFLMGFLGTIIICIISCIVLIPTFIMSWAQMSSQMGALGGDPLGVPAYFTPLLLIVLSITIFVLTYVASWLGISYAYLYGSNTSLEKKKKELQNTNDGSFTNQ